MHIGKHIEQVFRDQGRSVKWFADKLCYDRRNIYKIFKRESVDTDFLKKISVLLDHNFFNDIMEEDDTDSLGIN